MALTCLHWNNHASKVNNGGECSQYIDSTLLEYHTKLDNTCTGQTPRNALTVVAFGSHCCDLCFANRLSIVERWRLTWWQNEVGVPVQVIINAINAIVRAVLSATVLLLIYIWIEFQDLSCHAIGSSLWSLFKQASSCWYHSQRTFVVLRRSWFLNAVNFTLVHFIIEENASSSFVDLGWALIFSIVLNRYRPGSQCKIGKDPQTICCQATTSA